MRDILIWLAIVLLLDSAVSIDPCAGLTQDSVILENQKNHLESEYNKITKKWNNLEEEKYLLVQKVKEHENAFTMDKQNKSKLEKHIKNLEEQLEIKKKSVKIQNTHKEDLKAKVKSGDEMIEMLEKVNSELRDEIAFMRMKLDQKKNEHANNSPTWQRILHLAAKDGDINVIHFLMDKGVNMTMRDDLPEHRTPLLISAASGHAEVVQQLLNAGVLLNQTSASLNTALHEAAAAGHLEVCQLLLDRNTPMESLNNNNETPLKLAKKNGHQNVVDLLVKKGAKI